MRYCGSRRRSSASERIFKINLLMKHERRFCRSLKSPERRQKFIWWNKNRRSTCSCSDKQKLLQHRKKKYKNPSFMACYFNCCWPISTAETAVYSLAFFRVRFNQQASSFSAVYGMITLPMLPRSPPDWTPIKRRLANNGVKVHGVTSRRFAATCAALAAGDGA